MTAHKSRRHWMTLLSIWLAGALLILAGCDGPVTLPPATQTPSLPTATFTASVPTHTPAVATRTPSVPTRTPAVATRTPTLPTATPSPTATAAGPTLEPTTTPEAVIPITLPGGFGARKGFWSVYFTAPTGSRDPRTYTGGIETELAAAIDGVQRTLDIAAFEFNLPVLTEAVLRAKARGVQVRMVVDSEHGLEDKEATTPQLVAAGIPVVGDNRSALMHNKFMILDSTVVWTGSWNYSINDTYRNNNNALALRSQKVVANYQAEFDEMFSRGQFGASSPSNTPFRNFTQDGIGIQMYFAPEDRVVPALYIAVGKAQHSIKFMAFSFTLDDVADVAIVKADQGVDVRGIFEKTGSERRDSELRPMFCAGLQVRQDGNPFVLHHKVFIIDDSTVVAGSFNFSQSARADNDENMLIINDPDLAAQYATEFERRWAEASTPTEMRCGGS